MVVILCSEQIENLSGQRPTAPILIIQQREPLRSLLQSPNRSHLQGLEHTRIHLALHLKHLSDHLSVTGHHSDTPPCHIVSLAQGVKFQTAFLCARLCEDGQRVVIENETIWIIVAYQDVMPEGEVYKFRIQLLSCRRSGGHVRVIGPHDLDAAQIHLLQSLEIRLPSVLRLKVIRNHLRLNKF